MAALFHIFKQNEIHCLFGVNVLTVLSLYVWANAYQFLDYIPPEIRSSDVTFSRCVHKGFDPINLQM